LDEYSRRYKAFQELQFPWLVHQILKGIAQG